MKAQEIWKEIDPRKKMGKRWIPVQWKMLQIRSSLYSWIPVKQKKKTLEGIESGKKKSPGKENDGKEIL